MSGAAVKILLKAGTDKRFWKCLGGILVVIMLLITAVGTSCTAHNLQNYATNQVASDFAPTLSSVNDKVEDGQQINTSLLYSAYITLFDNSKYSNKDNVRKNLIRCFYTEEKKKVEVTDKDGKPKLNDKGEKQYTNKLIYVPITDNSIIFEKIEKAFNITVDKTHREYIIGLSKIIIPTGENSLGYSLSGNVLKYEPVVSDYCKKYSIAEYSQLILAIMEHESHGVGNDPMQCSESPLNTKYPQKHNGITDPNYSISIGIQYFESCLRAAKCKSPQDIPAISLALQGYNFGNGYISWAAKKGGYSQQNTAEFSHIQASKMCWNSYGDINYVSSVLRYYGNGLVSSGSFTLPIQIGKYKISSPFGNRSHPKSGNAEFHKGVDFAAPQGTPIHAGSNGKVTYAQFGGYPYTGYGNIVVLRHSPSLVSMYAHCSKLLVFPGQSVQQGQIIALVGSTGDSTGNHCHFEIRENGRSVNPMNYLK
jgi:hypothetical protein